MFGNIRLLTNITVGPIEGICWIISQPALDSFDMILKEKDIETTIVRNIIGVLANISCNGPEYRDIVLHSNVSETIYKYSTSSNEEKVDSALCWFFACLLQGFSHSSYPEIDTGKKLVGRLLDYFSRCNVPNILCEAAMGIEYFLHCEKDKWSRVDFVVGSRVGNRLKDLLFDRNLPFVAYKPLLHILYHLTSSTSEHSALIVDERCILVRPVIKAETEQVREVQELLLPAHGLPDLLKPHSDELCSQAVRYERRKPHDSLDRCAYKRRNEHQSAGFGDAGGLLQIGGHREL